MLKDSSQVQMPVWRETGVGSDNKAYRTTRPMGIPCIMEVNGPKQFVWAHGMRGLYASESNPNNTGNWARCCNQVAHKRKQ